jgi:hypothetical protein
VFLLVKRKVKAKNDTRCIRASAHLSADAVRRLGLCFHRTACARRCHEGHLSDRVACRLAGLRGVEHSRATGSPQLCRHAGGELWRRADLESRVISRKLPGHSIRSSLSVSNSTSVLALQVHLCRTRGLYGLQQRGPITTAVRWTSSCATATWCATSGRITVVLLTRQLAKTAVFFLDRRSAFCLRSDEACQGTRALRRIDQGESLQQHEARHN